MADVFLDLERAQSGDVAEDVPDGLIWGAKHADAYPGWTCVAGSECAAARSRKAGLPMHEVVIETNVCKLSLIFNSLVVEKGASP